VRLASAFLDPTFYLDRVSGLAKGSAGHCSEGRGFVVNPR
jgi:hypothetical protein